MVKPRTVRFIHLFMAMLSVMILGSTPTMAAKYTVLDGAIKNAGKITGRVIYNGTPPPIKMFTIEEDVEQCGSQRPSMELLVSKTKGISNVVLSIESITSGKDWSLPTEFVYDHQDCEFSPRVLIVKPKSAGSVLNSDPIGHNFHSVSRGIYNINKKISANSKMLVKKNKIRKPGIIRAKCDMHSWMKGWWIVAKNPYTVLSDADGNFSITDIAPGSYKVKIWHELLGESEQTVEVKANAEASLNVSLSI